MSSKILLPAIVNYLSEATGKSKKQAEAFLKAYFNVLSESLSDHDTVKIKEVGTFKVSRVEARKSVDVSTGEETRIPPHYKVVFTPSGSLSEKVNEEFGWLEIVEISGNVSNEELDAINEDDAIVLPYEELPLQEYKDSEQEEEESEKLGEELETDFGEIEPAEPFGPVDPDDPEPDEPVEQDMASPSLSEREGVSPIYLTEEEGKNFATRNDLKVISLNIKKLREEIRETREEERPRRKRSYALLWSLLFCAAFLTGGFFLLYHLLSMRLSAPNEVNLSQAVVEAPATQLDEEDKEAEEYQENDEAAAEPESAEPEDVVPTAPSDMKAMDQITSTRYLTTMAKEHYGNYNLWPYIYLENEERLGHPDRIKPGTKIVIPKIEKYNINPENPEDIEKAKRLGAEIYRRFSK